jgi:hypothetical protein
MAIKVECWIHEISELALMKVPRSFPKLVKVVERKIVTVVDASAEAHGAVIYVVFYYADRSVSSVMATSKAKVAPLKPVTIPCLELMAAVVGLHLCQVELVKSRHIQLSGNIYQLNKIQQLFEAEERHQAK